MAVTLRELLEDVKRVVDTNPATLDAPVVIAVSQGKGLRSLLPARLASKWDGGRLVWTAVPKDLT